MNPEELWETTLMGEILIIEQCLEFSIQKELKISLKKIKK